MSYPHGCTMTDPTEAQVAAVKAYYAGRDFVAGSHCTVKHSPIEPFDAQQYPSRGEETKRVVTGYRYYLYYSMDWPCGKRRYGSIELAPLDWVPVPYQFAAVERDVYACFFVPDEPADLWKGTFDEIADWQKRADEIANEAYARYDAAKAA